MGVTVDFTTTPTEFARAVRITLLRTGIGRAVLAIGVLCTCGAILTLSSQGFAVRNAFGLVFGATAVYICWWQPIAAARKAWRDSPVHAGPHRWTFTPIGVTVESPQAEPQSIPWTEVSGAYTADGFLVVRRVGGINMILPVRAIQANDRATVREIIQDALPGAAHVRGLAESAV